MPVDIEPMSPASTACNIADSALLHAVDAADIGSMATGMHVVPRWRDEREGHINDIECFVPGEG